MYDLQQGEIWFAELLTQTAITDFWSFQGKGIVPVGLLNSKTLGFIFFPL